MIKNKNYKNISLWIKNCGGLKLLIMSLAIILYLRIFAVPML